MGAYDNPKMIDAPNYMVGTQAFLKTFQKGLQEGLDKGQEMIADRKEYEDGVYGAGEKLKEQLDAALGNSADSKAKIQSALKKFYDKALAVDPQTKKGLGGLFSKPNERRMGKFDLLEVENSFTDAVAGVNTAFNYVYDPEIDIKENEDQGHEFYNEKLAIYEAVKAGKQNLDFDFVDGKFSSSITIDNPNFNKNKPEGPGNEKTKTYDPARIQAIFTASGKEQRDIIDNQHGEFGKTLKNTTVSAMKQDIAEGKYNNESTLTDFENDGRVAVREMLGTTNIEDWKTDMPDNKTMSYINDIYNNHADNVSTTQQITFLREAGLSEDKYSNAQLVEILNDNMLYGEDGYEARYGGEGTDFNKSDFNKSVLQAKARIVEESYMKDLKGSGIFNEAYRRVAPAEKRGLTDAEQKKLAIFDYAEKRTDAIAEITAGAMVTTNNPMDYTGSVQGGGGQPFGLDPSKPIGTTVAPGVKVFANPEYDEKEAEKQGEKYDVPKTVYGLKGSDEMRSNFIGKVLKVGNKGELKRIKDVFISPEGDITYDYFDGVITETKDGEKSQENIIDSSTPYNIYNPISMKSMYKTMLSDLKSEDATVLGDTAYAGLISDSYLNSPEQFASPKMDKWAGYIKKEFGMTKMIQNPEFMNWFWNKKQGAKLSDKHPWKPLYNALVDQEFSNL